MCCIFTILVFLGPRFGGIFWWLYQPARWVGNTGISAFDSALWPILGLIFLPWTTLMYVSIAPGGINGLFEWLFLIMAVAIDIGAYTGGGYGNRNQIPGMSSK
jgi:CDP-diglyceride synthetase